MAGKRSRLETALGLMLGVLAALALAILGLNLYIRWTAPVLHPDPQGVVSVAEAKPAPRWAEAVEHARQVMRRGIAEQNLPGVSVAVGVNGELVWAEGFGWADIEKRTPVTPTTRFRLGTASNVLAATAAGVLVDKGRLKLDEPIQTYVPEFPKKTGPVTLRQVLAHTAGIRSDGGDEGPLFSQHCERPAEGLKAFAERELLFEPGTQYRYSNYGGVVVSAAVEAAAKQPFLLFMREEVFKPLGMKDTLAESATEQVPERATLYFPRFGADPKHGLHLMRDMDLSCYAGAMVFLSTPADMVRFGMGVNGDKLLQPATVTMMQTTQRLPSGQETGYGLGWDLEKVTLAGQPVEVVGHDGDSLGGQAASLMVFRERGIVVAVMTNISYAETAKLALKVAEAFAGSGP